MTMHKTKLSPDNMIKQQNTRYMQRIF